MRHALLALALTLAACGTPTTGGPDGSEPADAGAPDSGAPAQIAESEPNDGNAAAETDPITLPCTVTGALSSADDVDIFDATLTAGTLITWTLTPGSSAMTPYLGIVEKDDSVPHLVVKGGAGAAVEQEQYVLKSSLWHAIVMDSRATPPGPGGDWTLTAALSTPAPTALAIPSTVQGSLRHRTAVALYRFHADANQGFDLVINAARKSPASDLDSRISLWDQTHQKWLATNDDDAAATTSDSRLFSDGLTAAADLVLVVENVSETAQDLSFELQASLR
jgi:hypothetical protein